MTDGFEMATPGRNRGTVNLPFPGKHAEHCRSRTNIDILWGLSLNRLTCLDVEVPYATRNRSMIIKYVDDARALGILKGVLQ